MAKKSAAENVKRVANMLLGGGNGEAKPPFLHQHRPTPKLLRLDHIELDPNQPRKNIGDISDLAASINEHGLIEPIVVQPAGSNLYRVIAGERRWHACKQVGLEVVPCMVRTPTEQQTIEIQLIENLHRKDLDPFEESDGYRRLKEEHSYTDAEIAQRMSKSRTHVTQTLSLTKVPPAVRTKCQSSDHHLSRDTLYLIAKQPNEGKMLAVLDDAVSGLPIEERRARARQGAAREGVTPTKPKWAYSSSDHHVTVVVQSHNSTLTKGRRIQALREALQKAEEE